MRFDLSDEEWSVLEPLMPKSRKSARPHDRRIINAIFYVLRTGIPWRDLPERYGPYTSAYNRFNRWSRRGVEAYFRCSRGKIAQQFVLDRWHHCESASRGSRRKRGEKNQAIGI